MRKVLLLLVGTASLWVPAISIAGDSSPKSAVARGITQSNVSGPADTCKSQRTGSGFAAGHNGQTFTQFYGTNHGKGHGAGANAFGKCVSRTAMRKAENDTKDTAKGRGTHGRDSAASDRNDSADSDGKDSTESHGKATANPAMTCKAMQATDLARFQSAYGTRPNTFGKCVSKQANGRKG
jgi:hypothetical protein